MDGKRGSVRTSWTPEHELEAQEEGPNLASVLRLMLGEWCLAGAGSLRHVAKHTSGPGAGSKEEGPGKDGAANFH